jgi:hypothetical protein
VQESSKDDVDASAHAPKALGGWDRVTWGEALVTAVSLGGIDVSDPAPFGAVLAAAGRELVPVSGLSASRFEEDVSTLTLERQGARKTTEDEQQALLFALPGIMSAVGCMFLLIFVRLSSSLYYSYF